MATTTSPIGFPAEAAGHTQAAHTEGFLARLFNSIIEARMRRAEQQIQPYLARLNDERLKDLGFTSPAIENLREKHVVQAIYWS